MSKSKQHATKEEDVDMSGENQDDDDSEGEVQEGEGEEVEIEDVVDSAMEQLVSLPEPEDVEEAMEVIKSRVKTLLYTQRVSNSFFSVLENEACPFPSKERKLLPALFQKCRVLEHVVYKDGEWTLSGRRDVCGASTSIEIGGEDEDESSPRIQVTMTWYWRADEEEGCVEEFSLVIDPDDDADSEGASDSEGESPSETSKEPECVPILEGIRTEAGGVQGSVCQEVLEEVEGLLESGLSPTSLLRFLVLCTRAECQKTQAKLSSITQGYDADEDAAEMCRFVALFEAAPHEGQGGGSSSKNGGKKGSEKKRGRQEASPGSSGDKGHGGKKVKK